MQYREELVRGGEMLTWTPRRARLVMDGIVVRSASTRDGSGNAVVV